MTTQERIQTMLDDLNNAILDAEKFDKGNASAGTRVRKVMQNLKNAAQDVRVHVQEVKNAG